MVNMVENGAKPEKVAAVVTRLK
ncbi:UNVERIFIED_CONTAM: hypothetical protein GTU68_056890 [Idotea baltica]|nr:hypothetical protein [Idotea baltica]